MRPFEGLHDLVHLHDGGRQAINSSINVNYYHSSPGEVREIIKEDS